MSTINSHLLFLCSYPPQCLFSYSIISWFTLARTWAAAGKSCAPCPDGETYTITKHFTSLELFPNLWECTVKHPSFLSLQVGDKQTATISHYHHGAGHLGRGGLLEVLSQTSMRHTRLYKTSFPFSYFWLSRVSGPPTVCWMLLWLSHGSEWVVILSAKLY